MTKNTLPTEILVYVGGLMTAGSSDAGLAARRGFTPTLPTVKAVDITSLQGQVNVFLQQLNVVMDDTPEEVGGFRLAEFEVSAGIVIEPRGPYELRYSATQRQAEV